MPTVVNKINTFSSSVSSSNVSGVQNELMSFSDSQETNFDVTANWSLIGVTDQATFRQYLIDMGFSTVNIPYFKLESGRLEAFLDMDGSYAIFFEAIQITEVKKIGEIAVNLGQISLVLNEIVDFNPVIPLPSNLSILDLTSNQIVSFNPNINLPIGLTSLGLSSNQMTTSGYVISESWATSQSSFTNNCEINFNSNLNSVSGTNLETILLTKNTTIIP